MSTLAAISVRGMIKVAQPIRDTMKMLKLPHQNYCVVMEDSVATRGMLNKVKDFVTWGELDQKVLGELIEKRGEPYGQAADRKNLYHYRYLEKNGKKYKKYFRLNPPRKGFGRKGVKQPFVRGGALGYRGDKINDLLKRMLW